MVDHADGIVPDTPDVAIRPCSRCGGEREHDVAVEVRERETRDSVRGENETHSRTPFRVYRCQYCGAATEERVR